ncbi:flagellar hook capping FlgD N-terminal domain-containing protein [Candidatus Epulonipiscium viviparus]|uniref:flagellar hook capping FlgD N-terminal domain-containing protein n=1 Tax=Candidatus Epulonipiscium viviparus TaxID=420336 RepID=UPI00016C0DB7|nr:flagellar hook capping FlgD N-terminal domain-containing protein [Candidatus Epulopiscium viviparus]
MSEVNNLSYIAPDNEIIQNKPETREPDQDLGKDAFMSLLITQLQYQDPLSPMDNSEMMAQMAQFTALEQMMNVALATNKQTALSMVGNFVEYSYKNLETGKTEYSSGKVEYVKTQGDDALLGIGENEVKLADIIQVLNTENVKPQITAFETLGKTVQAQSEHMNDDGIVEPSLIEGEVLEIKLKDGKPFVVIGTGTYELEIDFEKVKNVVENPSITGRTVTATTNDYNGNPIEVSGKAEYVSTLKDNTYVYVNNQFVNFNQITSIK